MNLINFKFRPEFIKDQTFDVKCFMEIFEQYTKDIKKEPKKPSTEKDRSDDYGPGL